MKTKFWHLGNMPEREEKYEIIEADDYHVIVEHGMKRDLLTFWDGLRNYKEEAKKKCDQLNGGEPTRFEEEIKGGELEVESMPKYVLYLGKSKHYENKDLFIIWTDNTEKLLVKGTLGNEEYLPYKVER